MGLPSANYTQFPNAIADSIADLSHGEIRVLIVICRYTSGFHRDVCKLSLPKLVELTGLSEQGVRNAIKKLQSRDWVEKNQHRDGTEYRLKFDAPQTDLPPTQLTPNLVDPQLSGTTPPTDLTSTPKSVDPQQALKSVTATIPQTLNKDLKKEVNKTSIGHGDRSDLVGDADASPSERKSPKRKKEAKGTNYTPAFEVWWKGYYEFCQDVSSEEKLVNPGKKSEAFAMWQKRFPDDRPTDEFLEGDSFYQEIKRREAKKNPEAIAISHGCRYIGDPDKDEKPKWKQAYDFKNRSKKPQGSAVGKTLSERESQALEQYRAIVAKEGGRFNLLENGWYEEQFPGSPGRRCRFDVEKIEEKIRVWNNVYRVGAIA